MRLIGSTNSDRGIVAKQRLHVDGRHRINPTYVTLQDAKRMKSVTLTGGKPNDGPIWPIHRPSPLSSGQGLKFMVRALKTLNGYVQAQTHATTCDYNYPQRQALSIDKRMRISIHEI
jgi:hypothetical protein